MDIQGFISLVGLQYQGKVPLVYQTMEALTSRLRSLERAVGGNPWGSLWAGRLVGDMRAALGALKATTLRYAELSALTARYAARHRGCEEGLTRDMGQWILALHDMYVLGGNGKARAHPVASHDHTASGCRQCGECCIGPAAGPISTSPRDLQLWEALGRDDLLYYTLPGSCHGPDRARSLTFAACPFLRFPEPGRGRCLVHPVKPNLCREFSCRSPQAATGENRPRG